MRGWSETNRWVVAIAVALVLAVVIVNAVQSDAFGGSPIPMVLLGIVTAAIFVRVLTWLGLLGFGERDDD